MSDNHFRCGPWVLLLFRTARSKSPKSRGIATEHGILRLRSAFASLRLRMTVVVLSRFIRCVQVVWATQIVVPRPSALRGLGSTSPCEHALGTSTDKHGGSPLPEKPPSALASEVTAFLSSNSREQVSKMDQRAVVPTARRVRTPVAPLSSENAMFPAHFFLCDSVVKTIR
jgi:hypothetical protein